MLRILIVTPYLPWPLCSGGNAAQFSSLLCLQEDHRFTLLVPIYTDAQIADALELQRNLPRVNVHAIFCGSRQPKLSAIAFCRSALLRALAIVGRKPQATGLPSDHIPFYPFYLLPRVFIEALFVEVAKRPDFVQIEFAEMLPLGAVLPPSLPKLFIHQQIHSVYADRFVATHGSSPYADYVTALIHAEECNYLNYYDGVIAFSEKDKQEINAMTPTVPVFVSPFPVPADVGITSLPLPQFDGRFVFLGSEPHDPNRDALQWLLAEIWPKIIQHLPTARLLVIGAWSNAWRQKFPCRSISFPGFVEDLPATVHGTVMLVPLRIGSGIRTKIITAMAQGVPVVSTTIGAEGLPVAAGKDLLISDDAASFAALAVQLAHDPDIWKRLTQNGLQMVSQFYSPDKVRETRNRIYSKLAH